MIRSILKVAVFGAITYAHASAVVGECKKPKGKRNNVQIALSTGIGGLGVLAIVGVVGNALNK